MNENNLARHLDRLRAALAYKRMDMSDEAQHMLQTSTEDLPDASDSLNEALLEFLLEVEAHVTKSDCT